MADSPENNVEQSQPQKTTFEKIKDDTKEVVNKLLSFFKQEKTADNITEKTPTNKLLKGIHKALVDQDAMRTADFKKDKRLSVNEERDNNRRHKEILKALQQITPETPIVEEPEEPEQPEEPIIKTETKKTVPAMKPKAKAKRVSKGKTTTARKAKPKAKTTKKTTSTKVATKKPSFAKKAGVAAGAVAAGTVATSAIAGAESGGDYNVSFGDTKDKTGKYINSKGYPTPEQLFHKKLTDMTLGDVQEFGRIRNSISKNSGATGAYQFMPTTLFGTSKAPGLVQQAGLSMDTKYNKETQDLLYSLFSKQSLSALQSRGVPITPGNEYMSHYIGPAGTAAVYRNTDKNKTVADVMAEANLATPGKQNNPELYVIKAVDFESILATRVKNKMSAPHAAAQTQGSSIDSGSKQNKELKEKVREDNSNNSTTNNVKVSEASEPETPRIKRIDDRNPMERVMYG